MKLAHRCIYIWCTDTEILPCWLITAQPSSTFYSPMCFILLKNSLDLPAIPQRKDQWPALAGDLLHCGQRSFRLTSAVQLAKYFEYQFCLPVRVLIGSQSLPFSQMFHKKGKAVLPTVQKVIQRFMEKEGKNMYNFNRNQQHRTKSNEMGSTSERNMQVQSRSQTEKSNALSWAPLARHKASGEQNRLNNHGKTLEEGGQRLCGHPGRLMLAWCTHVSDKDIDLQSSNLMAKWGSRNPGNNKSKAVLVTLLTK